MAGVGDVCYFHQAETDPTLTAVKTYRADEQRLANVIKRSEMTSSSCFWLQLFIGLPWQL